MPDDNWWVNQSELIEEQRAVVRLPTDGNHLVLGPPGSGKTNLLLLRANFLYLGGYRNIRVLTFTRFLREFIATGARRYDFPADRLTTFRAWAMEILRERDRNIQLPADFEEQRTVLIEEVRNELDREPLDVPYDSILIDEVQDHTSQEIELLTKLTPRLFCVGDSRQQLYSEGHGLSAAREQANGSVVKLTYHFRNGHEICKAADRLMQGVSGYVPMLPNSRYDESKIPSTVRVLRCRSLEEQIGAMVPQLALDMATFPGAMLGVLCPTNDGARRIFDALLSTEVGDRCQLNIRGESRTLDVEQAPIVVCTCHSAKGAEFRTVHFACADTASVFRRRRRSIIYTTITRARTALYVYHESAMPPELEKAVSVVPTGMPDFDRLFGGKP